MFLLNGNSKFLNMFTKKRTGLHRILRKDLGMTPYKANKKLQNDDLLG